jgi:hypothetical protein
MVSEVGEGMNEMLHIWMGAEMPEKYRRNIEESCKLLGPKDSHWFISEPAEIDCLEKEINDSAKFGPLYRKAFERVIEEPNYSIHTAKSDFFRMYICATRPHNIIYCDCDLMLTTFPRPKDTKPYFAEYSILTVDISLIVSNGDTQFFVDFLEQTSTFPRERGLFYGWLNKMVAKEKYGMIYINQFVHDGIYE